MTGTAAVQAPAESRCSAPNSDSDALEGGLLSGDESAIFSVRVEAGSAGSSTWAAHAWSDRDCDGGLFAREIHLDHGVACPDAKPDADAHPQADTDADADTHADTDAEPAAAHASSRCRACSRPGRRRRLPDPTRPRHRPPADPDARPLGSTGTERSPIDPVGVAHRDSHAPARARIRDAVALR